MIRPTKIAALAAAAVGALAMAACSSSSSSTTPAPGGASGGGSGVALVSAGNLTVCTHLPYAPFESPDSSGKVVGFDMDIMDLVAKKLGVTTKVVDMPFEGIKSGEATNGGQCDLSAAAMSITDERKKSILFSDPYYSAQQQLLLPPGSTVKSLADLKGKKLGAQSATTGLDYANAQKGANGYSVIEFSDLGLQTSALETGQIDAAINDSPVWGDEVKKNPGKAILGPSFDTGDNYGFGMKLGNTALKTVVDQVLKDSKADGSYASIYKKWIGTEPPK